MATTNIIMATDLWEGTHAVAWDNTLTIEAAKFADAQVGQKIVIEFTDATGEAIELHSNGGMLPGTRYAHSLYGDQHSMEVFITPGMLACLKEHGMEICGKGFTATKVWYGDGKDNVDENTVIRFYSEANRTDYAINVLTKWGDGGKLGDQTTMTMTNEYAELSLDGIDMTAKLADVDRLMVQCNKEGGNPFNFTAIVLVKSVCDAEITDASGYATFTTGAEALKIEGVEAFIAKVNGSKVSLTSVTEVPANSAVILKGAVGKYSFPVIESAEALTGNELKASDGTANGNVYVLANKTNGIGFYKLQSTDKVPAGKAYLQIASDAPEFLPIDGMGLTGISATLMNNEKVYNEIFNLAGQHVAQPAKGLYIVNGKKVIFK